MSFPANVIPVFGSQRAYADLNFAGGSFGLDGRIVNDLTLLSGYSFTRASLATMFDATGKLTYGPNNLLLQSQTFDNASWNKTSGGTGSAPVVTANTATAPDGTLTADTVVFELNGGTALGDISQLSQTPSATLSPSIYSFYARTTDGTSKVFSVVGSGGTFVSITITGAWQRFTAVEPLAGSSSVRIRLRGSASGEGTATSASIYLWGAQLEAVTYQTTPSTYYPTTSAAYYGARLVYDPVTLASLGILVEEARTNLNIYSEQFDNAFWIKSGNGAASAPVITANQALAPDGTMTADLAVFTLNGGTASGDISGIQQTVSSVGPSVQSLWARTSDGSTKVFSYVPPSGAVVSTVTITPEWQRISLADSSAGVASQRLRLRGSASGEGTATSASIYLWGAQLEAGTGASSYIPTTTASVTRAADTAYIAGIALTSAITLVSEANSGVVAGATFRVAACSDGTTNNRFGNYTAGSTGLNALLVAGGSFVSIASGARAANVPFKQASRYDGASTFSTSGNGAAVVSGTNTINPAVLTQLNIGGLPGVAESVGSTISRIRIYNRALSDAQLQSLTS